MEIKAYFDGCCEPINPGGTAAYGVVIYRNEKRMFEESKIFIPQKGHERETSNNVAEYHGFLRILNYLLEKKLQNEHITIYGDSMLVLCQMLMNDPTWNVRWKIKKGFYVPIALEAKKLLTKFTNISGQWIHREENSLADELSKRELIRAGIQFRIQPAG